MGWEDIDDMPTTNLRDELLSLLEKEVEYALPCEPSSPPKAAEEDDTDAVRRNVCQWNYECVDYFLFDRDVVYMSMHYFDRYLARHRQSGAGEPSVVLSHLLALSSLYLACKLHGVSTQPPDDAGDSSSGNSQQIGRQRKIRLQDFCNMSRGTYCPQMLEEMELSLLTNLKWKVHPPTPTDFLLRFVKILSILLSEDMMYDQQPVKATDIDNVGKGWSVFEVSRYQLELAVYSPELCHKYLPSKVALAAILNAMDSKVVKTKRTIIPSHIRRSFLQRVKYLGFDLNIEDEDMVEIRTTLKKLCSKTIVLPGQVLEEEEEPSRDVSFAPIMEEAKSFEYELPEVHSASGSSSSPVSVAADHF